MVAEVIKLPTVSNNIQTSNVNNTNVQAKLPGQGDSQPKVIQQSDRLAKQIEKNAENVRQAVNDVNKFVQQIKTNLKFSVDEASGKSVVTVLDSETGDVIRQIPAKEILAVANSLRDLNKIGAENTGILLTEQG